MKPEIKETIVQLNADGKTEDEIRAFLLESKVKVNSAELKKLLRELNPDEQKTEDQIVEELISAIESGKEESEIAESLLDAFPDAVNVQAEINKVMAIAKQKIAAKNFEQKKKDFQDASAKVKEEVDSSIQSVRDGISETISKIDEAIKVKRSHNHSFSRLLNAKTTLVRISKSLG